VGAEALKQRTRGEVAVQRIERVLLSIGKQEVKRLLDLPCGYGRILGDLKAAFPDAELTACDIKEEAVDFCAREFGAIPVYSRPDPRDVRLDGEFDLIWCGSLLTHLNAERWQGFFDLFESHLAPEGVLVFTTHGRRHAHWLRHGLLRWQGLDEERTRRLVQEYDEFGFGYQNHRGMENYGISLSSPSWVCRSLQSRPELRLISLVEIGWHGQDVFGCQRWRVIPVQSAAG
jgi:SAM-dependent methyltransferase